MSRPFDDTLRIYQSVARNLELPPDSIDEEPARGLDTVLRSLVRSRIEACGQQEVWNWLNSLPKK